MDEIVHENYPIARLPEDLRPAVGSGTARVIVAPIDCHAETVRHGLGALLRKARTLHPIGDDPVQRIRSLRDEPA